MRNAVERSVATQATTASKKVSDAMSRKANVSAAEASKATRSVTRRPTRASHAPPSAESIAIAVRHPADKMVNCVSKTSLRVATELASVQEVALWEPVRPMASAKRPPSAVCLATVPKANLAKHPPLGQAFASKATPPPIVATKQDVPLVTNASIRKTKGACAKALA
jgi:hypothetical protein